MTELRVVVFKESGMLLAQCLEHDVCVWASSYGELFHKLGLTLEAEDAVNGGLRMLPPAPSEFSEMWSG